MTDYIAGSPGDSGLRLEATCPACRQTHKLALARIGGRFMFSCGGDDMAGAVDDWEKFKAVAPLFQQQKESP